MATVPSTDTVNRSADDGPIVEPTKPKRRRRDTARLKLVPESRELREDLRVRLRAIAARLDKSRPITLDELERVARRMLDDVGLPEGYVGWTMVVLAGAFWEDQVAAVPFHRRLFLLPHCLKHAEGCPADYDAVGLDCRKCGACSIADFRTVAEDLGYKVLVAEGSPIVLKIIVSGHVDAVVGVACLNVLEKAIDKILLAGIPCLAVPLLSSDCRNTSVDEPWVREMIGVRRDAADVKTKSYVHLMRVAAAMFERAELERLIPRRYGGARHGAAATNGDGTTTRLDPIAGTEAIAYDFLSRGGKHSRPFITLAVYDALCGGRGCSTDGAACTAQLPDHVRRTALSIETFHKASLVHDDVEDDDAFRYGDETIHRRYGVPTAINVGDFLIGLGYRLVSRDAAALGPAAAADILDRLADAHMKLAEGQGAELLWRDGGDRRLTPLDALKIYALKTSPAFEAALYAGMRLAGPVGDGSGEAPSGAWIAPFARNLGVAFQILNDLGDWRGDDHNKLAAGTDVLGGRPTVLWALALEGLNDADRAELLALSSQPASPDVVQRVRRSYTTAGVFEKAARLVDKYQERAEATADEVPSEELRRLLYYLIDTVLDRPAETEPPMLHTLTSPPAPPHRP